MFDEYDDVWVEDANFYLPNWFITCFHADQTQKYLDAIERFTDLCPEYKLEIDFSGKWDDAVGSPALLCYSAGNLDKFWRIFDSL